LCEFFVVTTAHSLHFPYVAVYVG